ncbi:UNVERIFIED_CONTAM: putative sodium/metabolite cotransporter BASS4, chloroplastic [Sesamum radiatum]|uniref:Sodium/metabolite cotransporter BASS4, chloroplastic n=1 Tax=Sesamum radiatum TaxID=300843 RepID=A0AAW2NAV7_SESRA
MAGALRALNLKPPTAGTPFFRRQSQLPLVTQSPFSGDKSNAAHFTWKLRSVARVGSIRASAEYRQGNDDRENRLPQVLNSNWSNRLSKFAADNFLPLALVSGVVLGLANPSLGCLADTYYLSKLSTFGIFIISGLTLRSDEIGAAAEAWPVGLFGLASILIFTPFFSKIILLLKLQPQEFVTGLAIFSCMPTTLSSGVALTRLAGGNSALALAMTVISNLLGILFIPFSISKFIAAGVGVSVPTERLLRSLVLTLLVPLILGKKTLPVMVAVVEQLGGALGESGLLVLPCVAAHLNQEWDMMSTGPTADPSHILAETLLLHKPKEMTWGRLVAAFTVLLKETPWAIREVLRSPLIRGNAESRDDRSVVEELLDETRDWALVLPGRGGVMSSGGACGDGMDTGVGGLRFLIGP